MTTTKLLNTELFEQVIQHILEEPKRLRMNCWIRRMAGKGTKALTEFKKHYGVGKEHKIPECGTVACFAGWAYILGGQLKQKYRDVDYGVEHTAARLLIPDDINIDAKIIEQARHALGWELFRYHPVATIGTRNYAKAVAERAHGFIEKWSKAL